MNKPNTYEDIYNNMIDRLNKQCCEVLELLGCKLSYQISSDGKRKFITIEYKHLRYTIIPYVKHYIDNDITTTVPDYYDLNAFWFNNCVEWRKFLLPDELCQFVINSITLNQDSEKIYDGVGNN